MVETLSAAPTQLGLDLGEEVAPKSYAPDPADIRAELLDLISIARNAQDSAPWDLRTLRYHRKVFPQMARWLPADERDQLCFEFEQYATKIEYQLAA